METKYGVHVVCMFLVIVRACNGSYLFETSTPYIMTTWEIGVDSTDLAWKYLTEDGLSLLDSVERGISEACELQFCSNGVGPYDKFDEQGDLSLDAMMMDGDSKVVGAVGNLKRTRAAISVARAVMKYTTHTFITGQDADQFAKDMGFPEEEFRSNDTDQQWQEWKDGNCQPNFRQNVVPDPTQNCGPYSPPSHVKYAERTEYDGNHDTIGQFIIDDDQETVVGLSTNGLKYKIPGRVGDSPIPGAGGYAFSGVGAACATGNGDVMLRFLPSFEAVMRMEDGLRPDVALQTTVRRMREAFPDKDVAVMAGNTAGQFSAACSGYTSFPFVVRSHDMETTVIVIDCEESMIPPDDTDSAARGLAQPRHLVALCTLLGIWRAIRY